ncbi:putative Dicer-like protein [Zalerion maritima]|uniref:Dicer-like protein 1 n=1 Tax=Zalerion maritima TaxID=339359 RepID=A0AAD5RNB1_9PEZI|nr:putative Dicer-like protein [Zalerion maritima]
MLPEEPGPNGSTSTSAHMNSCSHGPPSAYGSSVQDATEAVDQDGYSSDSDNDGTNRLVINPGHKARKISEKRRADEAALESFVRAHQEEVVQTAPRKHKHLDEMSIAALSKTFQGAKKITPREYQTEIFHRTKEKNSIIVLDPGTGKTFIAVLLMQHILDKELEDRAAGMPHRIAFFLVDKIALVFQQAAVLETNLGHPVKSFCGSTLPGDDPVFWDKQFKEARAIVCTADILYKCLGRSYIRMDQINLLVFDEAHHAKKNHPYARIVKDFYRNPRDGSRQPRLLGMTASPVDANVDIAKASRDLERLLKSDIVTAKADSAPEHVERKDRLALYDPIKSPSVTSLTARLEPLIGQNPIFQEVWTCTKEANSQMGPWCADRMWELYLSEEQTEKYAARTESNLSRQILFPGQELKTKRIDEEVELLREARKVVTLNHSPEVINSPDFLSSKVRKLIEVLQNHFSHESNSRCIVFVRERYKAVVLTDLLSAKGIKPRFLRPSFLIGTTGTNESTSMSMTYRETLIRIRKFGAGDFNCLIATTVAEEGLDIPDCNIILRFDLYRTLIQYVQSRGRARQDESVYYHFAERGNLGHKKRICDIKDWETKLKDFCVELPEKRLKADDYDLDDVLRKEPNKVYRVPNTGAALNFKFALECLSNFVSSLPGGVHLSPEYTIVPVGHEFQAEVLLPRQSPIRKILGEIKRRKGVAKCSAAFEMCLELRRKKYLDDYLHPVFTKKLPKNHNARLAISPKKMDEYRMRIKPEIWSETNRGGPDQLYLTVITFSNPEALARKSKPLGLLFRKPLPNLPSVQLYFGTNRTSAANLLSVPVPLHPDEQQLEGLRIFTLRIFDDVFSKQFEASVADLPYLFAPLAISHGWSPSSEAGLRDINWDIIDVVESNESLGWQDQPDGFFEGKYVLDRNSGGRKFFLNRVRKDMKPTDKVPEWVVPPPSRGWKMRVAPRDIRLYSNSLWAKSLAKFVYIEDQPVVEAEIISLRLNLLDGDIKDEDMKPRNCFLILQPLVVSALPMEVVVSAYCLPAIIHAMESALIALDGCLACGLDIRPELALEAFTKDSDNSQDHGQEQVNFQAGMGRNYERLEFLGDCFLKMSTTISLYTQAPDQNEFEYHVARMLLICNQNLFNNALDLKLQEYVRSRGFDRRSWYPTGLTLKRGKKGQVQEKHRLGDKSIADVCEAVIGAAYLTTYDSNNVDLAVQAVTKFTKSPNHNLQKWEDLYASYSKPRWQTAPATAAQVDMANEFEKRMGYKFRYPRLLRTAFMHPSYQSDLYEKLPSYQRLEFLGDALYDMACVNFLFFRFPDADPQWLTEHKMAMVSNQFLGCLAVELGFHRHMKTFSAAVQKQKQVYAEEITIAREEAMGVAEKKGRMPEDYARNFWCDARLPPKSLPDVVEAYMGAIFVDSEYNYSVIQDFFDRFVQHYFEDMSIYDTYANKQPVTFLSNIMTQHFRCMEWRVILKEVAAGTVEKEGVDQRETANFLPEVGKNDVVAGVMIHNQVFSHGIAASGRCAKIAAAKKAMAQIEGLTPKEFRARFKCNCPIMDEDENLRYSNKVEDKVNEINHQLEAQRESVGGK